MWASRVRGPEVGREVWSRFNTDESEGRGEAKAKGPGNTGPAVKGMTGGVKSTAGSWTATNVVQGGASTTGVGKATGMAGVTESNVCANSTSTERSAV